MVLITIYVISAIVLIRTLQAQIKETENLFGTFRVPTSIEAVERKVKMWTSIRERECERAAAEEETR